MTHDTSIALTTAERRLCRIAAVLAAGIWLGAWLLIAILAGPTQTTEPPSLTATSPATQR